MKLAWLLATLLAVPAFAQTGAPRGTRIGQIQTAYLEDVPAATASAIEISDRFRGILDAARSSGAAALSSALVPTVNKGPRVEFETWVEQLSRDYAESVVAGNTGVERGGGKVTIHRFVRDNFRHDELKYTVTIETMAGGEAFRVSFSDSTVSYPVPQILRGGETVALTLSADARTGRKLMDYIHVGTGVIQQRREAARDVYADDAELALTQPRLRINGIEQPTATLPPSVSAPVVSIDIAERGRFALSFKPRADQGFEKAGEVAGNSIVLSYANEIFRIDCADRIATGSGTYNIYVRRELSRLDSQRARDDHDL